MKVKVKLTCDSEREIEHVIEIDPEYRQRAYVHDGVLYEAARQEADGTWIYRRDRHTR